MTTKTFRPATDREDAIRLSRTRAQDFSSFCCAGLEEAAKYTLEAFKEVYSSLGEEEAGRASWYCREFNQGLIEEWDWFYFKNLASDLVDEVLDRYPRPEILPMGLRK